MSHLELLVFGFIRDFQKQSKLSSHIAKEISYLIYEFYQTVTIVIKNGSGSIQAGQIGFTGDDELKSFPSIVGRPRHNGVMVNITVKDAYIGHEAVSKRGILSLKYPISHGVVTDWDNMQHLWNHTFKQELLINPKSCNVLLTETPLNPRANREKMTQIMFETFNVYGLYIAIDAMLSLYATGRLTGVVMDIGASVGLTVPVYEGYVLKDTVLRMDIGGEDITDYLSWILTERGYSFTTSADRIIVNDIKEKLCYVSEDYAVDRHPGKSSTEMEQNYELPDGQVITIGDERFRAMEILFQPSYRGLSAEGIHRLLYRSIMYCSMDLRSEMYANIVLSGGCCNTGTGRKGYVFAGMGERVKKEIIALAPATELTNINVIDIRDTNKENLAWIGGTILCSQDIFLDWIITSDEYNEFGASIVHRKCF